MQLVTVIKQLIAANKKTATLIGISLSMLAVSFITAQVGKYFDQRAIEKARLKDTEIARLQIYREAQTDSLNYYRRRLRELEKIIISKDLLLTTPPDEKKLFDHYSSLDDSTAQVLFNEYYGAGGLFDFSR